MKKFNKQITDELWRRGQLSFLLHSGQKSLYDLFYSSNQKKHVWLMSRRFGKSYALVLLALEQCLRQPNSIVKFASPTKDQVEKNVRPLIRDILDHLDAPCPTELKPEWHKQDKIYYFKNGSEIQLAGTDKGNGEKLRGGNSHIAIIDEAGSCSDLKNLVQSILLPTTLKTGGRIIMASTPPTEMDHEFLDFIEEAESRGMLIKKTIYDNPTLTKEQIETEISEAGGTHTTFFRREYMCEVIKDSNRSVIPEATPELFSQISKEWPKPPHYHSYESMDLGYNDLTVVLFGYHDYRADKVIIEDEIVIEGKDLHLSKLAQRILDKEAELWTNVMTGEVRRPYRRVSDTNLVAINEIRQASKNQVTFIAAQKDDNDSALNNVRMMLANKKIIIHPRCEVLLRHLLNVKWAPNKKTFARSPDDGHYDAVDALKYFVRHVVYSANPYPSTYDMELRDLFVTNPTSFNNTDNTSVYKRIFGRK